MVNEEWEWFRTSINRSTEITNQEMSSTYLVKKPKDLNKINSRDFGELLWWSYSLGVTLEKLVTTIDEVGDSTEQVKKCIEENN